AAPLPKSQPYHPVLRERAIRSIQELYWEQGYNDVQVDISTRRNVQAGALDVIVQIAEGRQSVIREIAVEGNQNTSENLIRTQLEVKSGDILNLQKLSNSRRNLYNTGAYSVVEIGREEVTPGSVRLTVKVRELQPFQVRYGGFYDTERGPGGIVDITNRN